MRIYIDESGTFVGAGKPSSPSIVGALVIPDHRHDALMRQYRRLRRSLPKENDEVKGRLLNEGQLNQVVTLLRSCDALFFANLIEMGLHSTEGLERQRAGGAEGLVRNLTDEIHPDVHKAFHELKARLEKLPLQLYVQGTVLNQLLAQILGEATAYWAQRRPDELGRFTWMMDAKGDAATLTEWEDWWTKVFMPLLQSQSLREPMGRLEGADYSHLQPFEMATPEYLAAHIKKPSPSGRSISLQKIFEDFTITSDPEPGLELVDMLTNGLRRAFKHTLAPQGWVPIRSLMLHRKDQYVGVVDFEGTQKTMAYPLDYRKVFHAFRRGGRSMLV